MKKIIITLSFFLGIVWIQNEALGQNWMLKTKSDNYAIKAVDDMGNQMDVVAVTVEGDDCFMDIKVVSGEELIPVKLIASDSLYIPVAGVTPAGDMYALRAITEDGSSLPIKGVGREGNTLRIAALPRAGDFKDIVAYSTDGKTKQVAGVKFQAENIELSVNGVKIIAHVKALPQVEIKTTELNWDIKAVGNDGSQLEIVAVNKKGDEFAVQAKSKGGNFSLMDVKAITKREDINVKLRKDGNNIVLAAIDYYGRVFPVKVKLPDGSMLDIAGGQNCGKTIDITATGPDGTIYLLNAISPAGDMYDIKGIKIKDEDNEGYVQGLEGLVFFYAHVKALPPVQ